MCVCVGVFFHAVGHRVGCGLRGYHFGLKFKDLLRILWFEDQSVLIFQSTIVVLIVVSRIAN